MLTGGKPEAVAVDFKDMNVMSKPVEQCARQPFGSEDGLNRLKYPFYLTTDSQKQTDEISNEPEETKVSGQPQQTGFAFYRVGILIKPEELRRLGNITLVPGMPAEVFVKTNDRTVLSYLMKPMIDQFQRLFQED